MLPYSIMYYHMYTNNIIKSKDQLKKDNSYTTVMNEAIEEELARTAELTARREQK